jgi:hypothetical protein
MLGFIQQGLGGRCYHLLCVISSDAIINGSEAPKEVAAKPVKTEFIADALKDLMRLPGLLPAALLVKALCKLKGSTSRLAFILRKNDFSATSSLCIVIVLYSPGSAPIRRSLLRSLGSADGKKLFLLWCWL